MIFISTANVYDGALDKIHVETDIAKADSEYGKFKIEYENYILNKLGNNTIIIRAPEIWGINCPRILKLESNIKEQYQFKHLKIYMLITQLISKLQNGFFIL